MPRISVDANVDRAINALASELKTTSHPLAGGKIIRDIELGAATPKRIAHGLGRPWKGWHLIDTTGPDAVYRTKLTTTDNAIELWLESASATTVALYIF